MGSRTLSERSTAPEKVSLEEVPVSLEILGLPLILLARASNRVLEEGKAKAAVARMA